MLMSKLSEYYLKNFENINRVMLCYDDKALLVYINNDKATYYIYSKERSIWIKDKDKRVLSKYKFLEELEFIELENFLDSEHINNNVCFKLLIEFDNEIDAITIENYGIYEEDFDNLIKLFLYQNTGIFAEFRYKNIYLNHLY